MNARAQASARPPGATPLVRIDGVYAKLECANPTGSVKDRIATFLLDEALARDELVPGDTVVEATPGNLGISLAWAARTRGLRVLLFVPGTAPPERRRILKRLGAEVRVTPADGGFAAALEHRDAYRDRPGYWVSDAFGNPDNTRCHRATLGAELVTELRARGVERLDAFVAGIGTGGTLMGAGEALRRTFPRVRIVPVEPVEAQALRGQPAHEHGIVGIGHGFVPALIDRARIDGPIAISSAEALDQARRLHAEFGLCVGVSSGANFAAALRLQREGAVTVATVLPDSADRYRALGLACPGDAGTACPLASDCQARTQALLGDL